MGNVSQRTQLRIENHTNTDIVSTSVRDVDNYDWDGPSRPDHNFNKVYIKSKGFLERREEVNARASHCPFTMTLHFRDKTEDTFRIHQKHAIGCCAGFQHMKKSHNIYYQRVGDNLLKITIEDKYEEALTKYKQAKELFNIGKCVKIVKESIEGVLEAIDDIDKAELNHNMNKVTVNNDVDENKDDNETETADIKQLIEIITS